MMLAALDYTSCLICLLVCLVKPIMSDCGYHVVGMKAVDAPDISVV
jgi:hypothetical protein